MRLLEKLQTLPALVLEGFVAGGILFFTLQPVDRPEPRTSAGAPEPSVLSTLEV